MWNLIQDSCLLHPTACATLNWVGILSLSYINYGSNNAGNKIWF
uniref:Uncharacterized protein n=1 Tax=Anguilla anguilla TaxID=7936 RepID=A0A0E9TNI9_ANGAN